MGTPINDILNVGSLIKIELEGRGLSQKMFAEAVGIKPSHLSEMIAGKRKIPVSLIPTIAELVGLPADTIINTQKSASALPSTSAVKSQQELETEKIISEFDTVVSVKSLLKGLGIASNSKREQLDALRNAYALPTPSDLTANFKRLSGRCFRRSAKNGLDARMIATWVVKARAAARNERPQATFDTSRTDEMAERVCAILHRNQNTLAELKHALNEYGIGFAVVEKEQHASIDGYSFIDSGTPYIVVTKRYNRIDNLAFTVMHELGHICLGHTFHGADMINVEARETNEEEMADGAEEPMESAANKFATDWLTPPQLWCLAPRVALNPRVIQSAYTKWAQSKNLNPWIVLGRVSHETGMYRFTSDATRTIN